MRCLNFGECVNAVCCSGKVKFSLCNINGNEKNCNLKQKKIVAMQMHLSIEEEGKRESWQQRRVLA